MILGISNGLHYNRKKKKHQALLEKKSRLH